MSAEATVKAIRLYFHQSIELVTKEGAVLYYRAGEYYHVAEEHVTEFLAKGVAKTERMLELEAEAARAEADEDKALADAREAIAPEPAEEAKPE